MVVPTFDFALAASSEEERFFFAAASSCSHVMIFSGGRIESNVVVGIRLGAEKLEVEVEVEDLSVITVVLIVIIEIFR